MAGNRIQEPGIGCSRQPASPPALPYPVAMAVEQLGAQKALGCRESSVRFRSMKFYGFFRSYKYQISK